MPSKSIQRSRIPNLSLLWKGLIFYFQTMTVLMLSSQEKEKNVVTSSAIVIWNVLRLRKEPSLIGGINKIQLCIQLWSIVVINIPLSFSIYVSKLLYSRVINPSLHLKKQE